MFASCTKKALTPQNHTSDSTATGTDSTVVNNTSPTFNSPAGLAIDAAGNLYVADYGNNEIRKITSAGIVTTIAGNGTQGSINAADTLATFSGPTGVAVDAAGNLYIADSGNNLIREISTSRLVTTLAGGDTTGSAINGVGINASFFAPTGVALDKTGNIYVADSGDDLIRKVTSAGTVTTIAGNGASGTETAALFDNPSGLAIDASSNIFVAGYVANNILKINGAGTVSIFAGSASSVSGAANGAGTAASFYYPNSVATDATGNVYVADGVNNLIRKITPDGTVSTLAGSGVAGAIDSTGTAASFNGPSGLVVDATGNVYVADSNNNLIRKITPAGVVTTYAGNGQAGARNGQAFAHRNIKALKINQKKQLSVRTNLSLMWLHKRE